MNTKLSGLARSSAVAAVSSLVAGGMAFAITSNTFTYSPAQNGALMIDALEMAPDGALSADNYTVNYSGGELFGSGCFGTAIHLPQGARLVELRIFFQSGGSSDPNFTLVKHAPSTATNTNIVGTQLLDNSNTRKVAVFNLAANPNRIINNAVAGYGFGFCMGSSDIFFGARIAYSFSSAGD
jgi:hypothetical protein